MRAVMGLCTLVATLAGPVMAIPITEVWFSDDFNSYPEGTPLGQAAPNWAGGGGPELLIKSWGPPGNKAVRMRGNSGTGVASEAYTANSVESYSAGKAQILRFTLQSDLAHQADVGNHLYIQLNDATGAEMGRWYGWSYGVTPRTGGNTGSAISITDGAVHEFAMVYDPVTGQTNWLHNDALAWTYNIGAGRACAKIWVKDLARGADDYVWFDDVVLGAPEPASLALLGLGGLFLVRRRRA